MGTTTRTARQTGTPITTGTADAMGLDADGGNCKWYTVCDTHGTCIGHTSRRLAESWASAPKEWCEFCADPSTWCATCANDIGHCDHEPAVR